MTYLLAVQAPAYSIDAGRFATEGAFAEHLKSIRKQLAARFDHVLLVGPSLSRAAYEASRGQLIEVSSKEDGVSYMPVHGLEVSTVGFWRNAVPMWRMLRRATREAGFIHTAVSEDIRRPYLAMLNLAAWLERKPTAFFVDIDFRRNSRRYYQLGEWGLKSYVVNRCLHDIVKSAQVALAARTCDLVLLKSASMVADFGRKRRNVRFFLNAAHDDGHIIDQAEFDKKIAEVKANAGRDLRVIYFGRLVRYKGLDYIIEAVARARSQGAKIALTIIGDGDEKQSLKDLSFSHGLEQAVTFIPGVRYGPELFDIIDAADLAIAAPRVEDTPRAALDAMARGLPILAFDTEYFSSLSELSGAVTLAAWPKPESLADQLVEIDKDRARIARMAQNAVAYARENTQDFWLRRRTEWTFDALDAHHRRTSAQDLDLAHGARPRSQKITPSPTTLQVFESQAEQRRPTTIAQFLDKVREFIRLDGRPLYPKGPPRRGRNESRERQAHRELAAYDERLRLQKESQGEQAVGEHLGKSHPLVANKNERNKSSNRAKKS